MSTTLNWPSFLWGTDIHLDAVRKDKVYRRLFDSILFADEKIVFLTGDLSSCEPHSKKKIPKLVHHLEMISGACAGKEVYFVLGNHDYWYSGTESVREALPSIVKNFPNLTWLGNQEPIQLDDETFLVGHDGWYDLRNAPAPSRGGMNDWNYMIDFREALAKTFDLGKKSTKDGEEAITKTCQALADEGTAYVKKGIFESIEAGAKKVVIITHFPPFIENALHQGRVDEAWIGCYTNQGMGSMLMEMAQENSGVEFLVLCGHSHSELANRPAPNLVCLTGGSEYSAPQLQPPLPDFFRKFEGS